MNKIQQHEMEPHGDPTHGRVSCESFLCWFRFQKQWKTQSKRNQVRSWINQPIIRKMTQQLNWKRQMKWVNKTHNYEMETIKTLWRPNPTILVFPFHSFQTLSLSSLRIPRPFLRRKRAVVLYLYFFERSLAEDGNDGCGG